MINEVKNIIYDELITFSIISIFKNFDPNNIEVDEKSYKNILIYCIWYVTIKKDLKIYSINHLYICFGKFNGYFVEINGNKYLTLVPTNESKEKLKKVWRTKE